MPTDIADLDTPLQKRRAIDGQAIDSQVTEAESVIQSKLQQLPQLYALLRANDFVVTLDRWQGFNDLLIRLRLEGRFPDTWQVLGELACPLFASSASEQEEFWRIFNAWRNRQYLKGVAKGELTNIPPVKATIAPQESQIQQQKTLQNRGSANYFWVGLAIVILLIIGVVTWQFTPETTITADEPQEITQNTATGENTPVFNPGQSTPLKPVPPRQPAELIAFNADVSQYYYVLLLLACLPAVMLGCCYLWRRSRHRMLLRGQSGAQEDPLENLYLSGESPEVFDLDGAEQNLRRNVSFESQILDPKLTINATIRNGGLFTPVQTMRWRRPDYLVLIDYRHRLDHTTQYFIKLIRQLAKTQQIGVHLYEYRRDPRVCYRLDATGNAPIKLHNLTLLHPNASLLVTGAADGLFHTFSGKILPWVDLFYYWQTRIWLSPRIQPWGRREAQLVDAGFNVAPLSGRGIQNSIALLDKPRQNATQLAGQTSEGYPELLQKDEAQWLLSYPPEDYDFQQFREALFDYLGPRGLELLIACAAYPHLHADLSLALEQKLFPHDTSPRKERRLLKLSRLPWFHQQSIPAYIRRDLIRSQSRASQRKTGEIYRDIFKDISTEENALAQPLYIAGNRTGTGSSKSTLSAKAFLRYLRDLVRFAKPDSLFADRIFSRVLMSGTNRILDFLVPDTLAKWLPVPQSLLWPAMTVLCTLSATLATTHLGWQNGLQSLAQTNEHRRVLANNARFTVVINTDSAAPELGGALALALEKHGYTVKLNANSVKKTNIRNSSQSVDASSPASFLPLISDIRFNEELQPIARDIRDRLLYLTYGSAEVSFNALLGSLSAATEPDDDPLAANTAEVTLMGNITAGGTLFDSFVTEFSQSQWRAELDRLTFLAEISEQQQTDSEDTSPNIVEFNDTLRDGGTGPTMVMIPAGSFVMGSAFDEPNRLSREGPQRQVSVASFAVGKYEVTFDEYDVFANATGRTPPDDGNWGRGQRPVINVSWQNAHAYVSWLSAQTGQPYRLLSEAEWEYAARAGTTTPFSTGNCINEQQANFRNSSAYADCPVTEVSPEKTAIVGTYESNAFGLHDMHGNVFEWVQDCWHNSYINAPATGTPWQEESEGDCSGHVLRGGSWYDAPRFLRSSFRDRYSSDGAGLSVGFRIARDI